MVPLLSITHEHRLYCDVRALLGRLNWFQQTPILILVSQESSACQEIISELQLRSSSFTCG